MGSDKSCRLIILQAPVMVVKNSPLLVLRRAGLASVLQQGSNSWAVETQAMRRSWGGWQGLGWASASPSGLLGAGLHRGSGACDVSIPFSLPPLRNNVRYLAGSVAPHQALRIRHRNPREDKLQSLDGKTHRNVTVPELCLY